VDGDAHPCARPRHCNGEAGSLANSHTAWSSAAAQRAAAATRHVTAAAAQRTAVPQREATVVQHAALAAHPPAGDTDRPRKPIGSSRDTSSSYPMVSSMSNKTFHLGHLASCCCRSPGARHVFASLPQPGTVIPNLFVLNFIGG
jgi:hypothetical protein